MLGGCPEGHKQASMLERMIVFCSTGWIVAEIDIGRFADILAHVSGCMGGGLDNLAVDVVGVAGNAKPCRVQPAPINPVGLSNDVKVGVPLV